MLVEDSVGSSFPFHQGTIPDEIGSRRFLTEAALLHELRCSPSDRARTSRLKIKDD